MELSESQIKKLKTAYNKGDRVVVIKNSALPSIKETFKDYKSVPEKYNNLNLYKQEDIHWLIN